MIIHWQSKNAGPTGQAIVSIFNTFTSARLVVDSVVIAPDKRFMVNIGKMGLR